MREMTSDQVVIIWLKELKRAVDNFFINNKNFKSDDPWNKQPYYFEHYKLPSYVDGPMREQAEFLKEKIDGIIEYLESPDEEKLND